MNEFTKDILSLTFNTAILVLLLTVVYRAGIIVNTIRNLTSTLATHEERSKSKWVEHRKEEDEYREGHQSQHIREEIARKD